MPIRTTQIPKVQQIFEEKVRKAAILKLKYVGEACIKEARLKGSYIDRTGNLRSSIGYVIVVDGNVVSNSTFEVVKNGKQGSTDGANYAQRLAISYPQGIALIVVAGMNYADYVQRRGYNVLVSAELLAEQLLKKLKLNGTKSEI